MREWLSTITKAISAKPDLLFTSLWGSDSLAFYKQALRYDLYKKYGLKDFDTLNGDVSVWQWREAQEQFLRGARGWSRLCVAISAC